jgi:hypothetical protein
MLSFVFICEDVLRNKIHMIKNLLRFNVLTMVKMSIVVFLVLMSCSLVGGYQCSSQNVGNYPQSNMASQPRSVLSLPLPWYSTKITSCRHKQYKLGHNFLQNKN